jgi:hypothetical protein
LRLRTSFISLILIYPPIPHETGPFEGEQVTVAARAAERREAAGGWRGAPGTRITLETEALLRGPQRISRRRTAHPSLPLHLRQGYSVLPGLASEVRS